MGHQKMQYGGLGKIKRMGEEVGEMGMMIRSRLGRLEKREYSRKTDETQDRNNRKNKDKPKKGTVVDEPTNKVKPEDLSIFRALKEIVVYTVKGLATTVVVAGAMILTGGYRLGRRLYRSLKNKVTPEKYRPKEVAVKGDGKQQAEEDEVKLPKFLAKLIENLLGGFIRDGMAFQLFTNERFVSLYRISTELLSKDANINRKLGPLMAGMPINQDSNMTSTYMSISFQIPLTTEYDPEKVIATAHFKAKMKLLVTEINQFNKDFSKAETEEDMRKLQERLSKRMLEDHHILQFEKAYVEVLRNQELINVDLSRFVPSVDEELEIEGLNKEDEENNIIKPSEKKKVNSSTILDAEFDEKPNQKK